MRVEILCIQDCPNGAEALTRVRAALSEIGHDHGVDDEDVTVRVLTSSADAAEVAFAGSPTILLDGADAFPTRGRTADLACRIYPTDAGFAGVPTVGQLVEAMRHHL